jgi:hypothetical protein
MPFVTPITDRTITDIVNKTDKSFFNVADWIRINGNTTYVRALMYVLRGINIDFTALDTPAITTMPTVAEFNSFIQNIENIRLAIGLPESVGVIPLKTDYEAIENSEVPDYTDANAWEANLLLIKQLTISVSTFMVMCGVGASGQPRYWQNRFRNMFVKSVDHPVQRPITGVAVAGVGLMRQSGWRQYNDGL